MHTIYDFVTGPLAWAAFIVFFGGLLFRILYILNKVRKKDPIVRNYISLKYSLRSFIVWLTPFAARNWRLRPVFTVATFAFHICAVLAPILLSAHVVMVNTAWDVSWWTLPDAVADWMTVIAVVACIYFFVRRLTLPEAQYVTGPWDLVIIALVALPFITGFLAYHQIFDYQVMVILHILSGEVLLAIIPFTWLSHMVTGPLVRAYLGSEFGAVRHARDW
jgi:nitrate reductase gamma subunit